MARYKIQDRRVDGLGCVGGALTAVFVTRGNHLVIAEFPVAPLPFRKPSAEDARKNAGLFLDALKAFEAEQKKA